LQQPFTGPSIVVKREQQHALEQVVMQVLPASHFLPPMVLLQLHRRAR
jgi:hypothetical protein